MPSTLGKTGGGIAGSGREGELEALSRPGRGRGPTKWGG
ncbi:hypothetical protein [Azospirillum endophyticum]